MGRKPDKVWAIAYINRSFIPLVEEEIKRYNYKEVEIYIPTVKILRKQFKGKNMFEMVPLLFNYGFFKLPWDMACNAEKLLELRHRISCIHGWVRDPSSDLVNNFSMRGDNDNFRQALPRTAIATDEEVARMTKASQGMSIYCEEDLKRLKTGEYIKLEGYPFEGMPAEILNINHKKKEVRVKLLMDAIVKEIKVSFDNVFYTIYKDFEEESREVSSDELKEKYGENTIDHITWKRQML